MLKCLTSLLISWRSLPKIQILAGLCWLLLVFFVSDFVTFGKPAEFDRKCRFLDKFCTIYCIYHTSFMTTVCCNNLFLINQCKEMNVQLNITEICGLISSIWMPFDVDYFPLKEIIFIYQVLLFLRLEYVIWRFEVVYLIYTLFM